MGINKQIRDLLENGEPQKGIDLAKSFMREGKLKTLSVEHSAEFLSQVGQCYENQGEINQATGCYEKAIEMYKFDPLPYLRLGKIAVERKDYVAASQYFNGGLKFSAENTFLAAAAIDLALHLGDIAKAKHIFTGLPEKVKDSNQSIFRRKGDIRFANGNLSVAKQIYDDGIVRFPHYPAMHTCRAHLALKEEDFTTAKKHALEAIDMSSSSWKNYAVLADVAVHESDNSEAEFLLQKAFHGLVYECRPLALQNLAIAAMVVNALAQPGKRKSAFDTEVAAQARDGKFDPAEVAKITKHDRKYSTAEFHNIITRCLKNNGFKVQASKASDHDAATWRETVSRPGNSGPALGG